MAATGSPAPTYSLLAAPSGMAIDPQSGLITWLPATPGTFDVSVQASNPAGSAIQRFSLTVQPAGGYVWPSPSWPTASPAEMGMDPAKLQQARDYALSGGGSGYIIRHGRMVLSWGSPSALYDLKSTTKSFGSTALGLLVKDGKMRLEDLAAPYHYSFGVPPQSNSETGWLDDITILQLASQSAGFDKPGGYINLLYPPGATWAYSDGGANWLAENMTLTFAEDLNSVMFRRVFTPIGITTGDLSWRSNIYRDDTINGIKNREIGSGISADVDAMARIGYLYLRQGKWNSQEILPQSYINRARTSIPENSGLPERDPANDCNASEHYGLLWWNNADGSMQNAPRDTFFSWGLYESLIIVYPSLDIVVARAGDSLQIGTSSCYDVLRPFIEPIAQSVLDLDPQGPTATPSPTQSPAPTAAPTFLWIAANSGMLSGAMAVSADYASGSLVGELVYPNTTSWNTGNTSQADAASYSVNLPSSGSWYAWARLYYPGISSTPYNDPNSFWLAMDSGAAQILGNRTDQDQTWHWDGSASVKISLGYLNAGRHTLNIWNREAREDASKLSPRLDVLLLTNSSDYLPNDDDARAGLGLRATPTPSVTATSSRTPTETQTRAATATRTPTATQTRTPAVTSTPTPTSTGTSQLTGTPSPTRTPTPTHTLTPTRTSAVTPTPTSTATETSQPIGTPSPTATRTPTTTQTQTATATRTPTATQTRTPAVTPTPTPTSTGTSQPTRTSSPTATRTPTPIRTLTPTPTKTAASSATPTQIITPDLIFADSFELGNLSGWSSSVTDQGNLNAAIAAAMDGSFGMQAVINDNNSLYVVDDHPQAEPRYRARFYFDPNGVKMTAGGPYILFSGLSGETEALRVELRFQSGKYQVRAGLANDSNGWKNLSWFALSDGPHSIELDWKASSGPRANNGSLTLWIDGSQKGSQSGVDNDTRKITTARLGLVSGLDAGLRGTVYFDAFESRRQTYIGP